MKMVPASKNASDCKTNMFLCETASGAGTTNTNDCSKVKASGLSPSCGPVTIGQYEACILATRTRRLEAAQLTCDDAGKDHAKAYVDIAPECEVVRELCPSVVP
jgi:hypothetical protein